LKALSACTIQSYDVDAVWFIGAISFGKSCRLSAGDLKVALSGSPRPLLLKECLKVGHEELLYGNASRTDDEGMLGLNFWAKTLMPLLVVRLSNTRF